MLEGERQKLVHMEERLQQRVIGQEEGITVVVANAVRRSRSGLQDPNRPVVARLFFSAPTGVGKTEIERARWRSFCSTMKPLNHAHRHASE